MELSLDRLVDKRKLDLIPLQQKFYVELKVQGKSPNTLKNYKTDLDCFNKYLIFLTGQAGVTDFNVAKVIEYGTHLQQKYSSDNSRRRRVQALRIFFDFLLKNGHVNENPVKKLPTSPKFLDIPRPTSLIDIQKLWAHLCRESKNTKKLDALIAQRNQLVVLLIYGAGLKVSDLAKLKMSCIQTSASGEYRVMVIPPKRDAYTVPLLGIFGKVFDRYNTLMAELKREGRIEFEEVLFNANPYQILSGGLSPRGLEIVFEDLRKKLNISLTPKSLRQSCVFRWLAKNRNESQIKEWMGLSPSYGLKLYRDHLTNHAYSDEFLEDIWNANQ